MSHQPPTLTPFHVIVRCRAINAKERLAGAQRFPYRRDLGFQCALVPHEHHEPDSFVSIFDPDSTTILRVPTPTGPLQEGERRYAFQNVCGPTTTNEELFHIAVRPLVRAAWDGYHSTCFAYGMTGTGKSFTMVGEPPLVEGSHERSVLGMCHYVVRDLFNLVSDASAVDRGGAPRRPSLRHDDGTTGDEAGISISATYVELYNEQIRDLLDPKHDDHKRTTSDSGSGWATSLGRGTPYSSATKSSPLPIDIVEDPSGGTALRNVHSVKVSSIGALEVILEQGNLRRTKASTNTNLCSSRSHAILQLTIRRWRMDDRGEQQILNSSSPRRAKGTPAASECIVSRLSLVDLAGSERAHATSDLSAGTGTGWDTEHRADRRREGATINKSLLALGNCINALGLYHQQQQIAAGSRSTSTESSSSIPTAAAPFVPYRDSKLTRLLRDSLGGNTRTVMIATISPSCLCYEETLATLKYATRAKAISRQITCNVVVAGPPPSEMLPRDTPVLREGSPSLFSIPPPLRHSLSIRGEIDVPTAHASRGNTKSDRPDRAGVAEVESHRRCCGAERSQTPPPPRPEQQMLEEEWEAKVVQARTQLRIVEATADRLLCHHHPGSTAPTPLVTTPTPGEAIRPSFVDPYRNPVAIEQHATKQTAGRVVELAGSQQAAAAAPKESVAFQRDCPEKQQGGEQSSSHRQHSEKEKLQQFFQLQKQLLQLMEAQQRKDVAPPQTAVDQNCPPSSTAARSSKPASEAKPAVSRHAAPLSPLTPNRTYTVRSQCGPSRTGPASSTAPRGGASSFVETIRRHWDNEKRSENSRIIDDFLNETRNAS